MLEYSYLNDDFDEDDDFDADEDLGQTSDIESEDSWETEEDVSEWFYDDSDETDEDDSQETIWDEDEMEDDEPVLGPHQGMDEEEDEDDPLETVFWDEDDIEDDEPILGPHQGKDEDDSDDDDPVLGPHQGKDEDDSDDDDPVLGPHQGKDEDDSDDDDPVLGPHQGKDEDDSNDDDPVLGPHQGKDEDDSEDEPILGPHQGKNEEDSDDDDPVLGPHQGKDDDETDDAFDLDIDFEDWLDDFTGGDEDDLEAFDEPFLGPHQGSSGGAPNYENFDFSNDDLENVVGDISEDMDNWHEQEGNTCAVCAQEFVLEALTGREFDMDELRELAEDNGWYDDGTPLWDVGNLLEHYGLQVDKFTGGTCEDIQECLNAGGKVIVSVDSDEVWFGGNDDLFFPGVDADHAVQVIGFDYSNPSEPMVILNDSGVANGCGAMISLENFQEAWEDGDCFMVTAYA